MNLLTELLIITIFGGIVSLDTTACFQIMISQPLVSCTLVGWAFGYTELGLLMGILMQTPWLLEMPIGGAKNSEGNLGSLVAAGLAIHFVNNSITLTNIAIVFAVVWGLVVSWIGWKFVESMRRSNVKLSYLADKAAEKINLSRISWLHLIGTVYAFWIGAIVTFVSFLLGTLLYSRLVAYVPDFFDVPFGYAKFGLMALGVGAMISMFLNRRNLIYFVGGVVISLIVAIVF
ncbi:PTS sugar transporter subunit IIC [candidate division KSB1 bacterium]|nr:PTS sugar transporter subunit IIC [candidate division KSB1 bacterium]